MRKIIHHITQKIDNFRNREQSITPPKLHDAEPIPHPQTQTLKIEIDSSTIVKILLIVAMFLALSNIFIVLKSILIITTISLFLSAGLAPIVTKIESYHIPRPIAIFLLYLIFFGIFSILFLGVIPILAEQLGHMANDLRVLLSNNSNNTVILSKIGAIFEFKTLELQSFLSQNVESISSNLKGIANSTFSIISDIFQGVFNLIFALVLIFFMLMERERLAHFLLILLPKSKQKYASQKFDVVQKKMAQWFRGQTILMICVGATMYIGMKIFEVTLGMKYALAIGIFAGIMELFPYIGVMLTGIIASLIAVNISWILLIAVLLWIAFVQFIEGNVLVPIIMERIIGLSSVAILLVIAIGGTLGNAVGGVALSILGIILAIPVAGSIAIFIEEYTQRGNKKDK